MATKPSYKHTQNPELIRRFVNSCLLSLSNHHNIDTSSLLICLTSEKGLKRLNGILGMPMSIEAAHDLDTLSFQFVVLPLIGVLTRESVCRSTMAEVSKIYASVYAHREKFIKAGIIPIVKKLIDRGYLEDRSPAADCIQWDDGYLCIVTSLSCTLLAIVRLIYQIVIHIPDSRNDLLRTVRTLDIWVHTWAKMSKGSNRDLFINKIMVKEVKRLLRIVSEAEDTVIPLLDVATAAPGTGVVEWKECRLDVNNTNSIKHAVETLQSYSTMEDAQAQALVEMLRREIALIHGPPGTGKTWISAALMQVLLANSAQSKCGPILYICRTDHALDQALNHLGNVVRIRLEQYSVEAVVDVATLEDTNNGAFKEIHRGLLRQCSVVGMTTNGVTKSQELIKTLMPKIIICEEASEIMEAHILSVLSPSTQHLILISDHKQLSPQINKYNLSSNTPTGNNYSLDITLFERIATSTTSSLLMSELKTQRHMRPSISELIRWPLYLDLIDGDDVHHYPSVRGMAENLFFMNHHHAEDVSNKNGVQSYSNAFEVSMVNAFIKYLVKNGYGEPGEIAIVTPYLAQLSKLRTAFKGNFKLVINERDQGQLEQYDLEEENEGQNCGDVQDGATIWIDNGLHQKQIALSTIENIKEVEANIVIISLARNKSENYPSSSGKIDPLELPSYTNVLLSHAQHGMLIIGNTDLMENETNNLWLSVISELGIHDRIGLGFPLKCQSHPEQLRIAECAKTFRNGAPNGGYTLKCSRVRINQKVSTCKHQYEVQCWESALKAKATCTRPCDSELPCGHACTKICSTCQKETGHSQCSLKCDKTLFCGHICGGPCH
ncbi:hypothetical protein MVEG_10978 [Podila verticillata NRRL 6337]|uniref:AAA+ ATPase domain-containing protein n=1 Tax=Podila verticillata NRRL 6337 TaxID=1069443 RepID=A0A086TLW3_9FUNG|nr:hypothetical protein MVEG_10978 [Podila verticillata NRRL 6337]